MIRTLETLFRRQLQFLFILVVLPAVGLAIAYFLPPSYQTTARLWALHRYEIIGSTGPESNMNASPAETQASAISELLQSRTFALTVAHETQLASALHLSSSVLNDPQRLDDALFNEISQHVLATAVGYNLFQITYSSQNPVVAQQVVAAVVKHYSTESQAFSIAEAQRLLQSYTTQYAKAKQERDAAAAAEAKYVNSHPSLFAAGKDPSQTDPQYALLHGQTLQAQATLDGLNTNITMISQQINARGSGSDSLFRVIDSPVVDNSPLSRAKLYSTAGGIGLGLAILACILYVVILVRRDHGIYTAMDLQKVISASVIVECPALTSKAVPVLIEQSVS